MPNTPGIYIQENNAFPNSVVAVDTAVPVFIGYTQKAEQNGKSLIYKPTRISSFAEYVDLFGLNFKPTIKITEPLSESDAETFLLNGKRMQVNINDNNRLYFYDALRFFYGNGGSNCYILSVGTYAGKIGSFEIDFTDFTGNDIKPNVFTILEQEYEPTIVVLPDIIAKGIAAYSIYKLMLQHCNKMQTRFAIFDVVQLNNKQTMAGDIEHFRNGIGLSFLNYGAAYYPWLKTSVIHHSEIDFTNLDATIDLENLLAEPTAKKIAADIKLLNIEMLNNKRAALHQSLLVCSTGYAGIMEAVKNKLNILPPSAAMAGIYTMVDNTIGVWKSPANISISMVNLPSINVSSEEQKNINADVFSGKSINVIRYFSGKGTLIWGARTLDGNSQDWRYINVKRTVIMIKESLKLACRTYIFEPNDASTWVRLSSMINDFLFNLWKQGALTGTNPKQAYAVQIGLGQTMTANDILNGLLKITILIALLRPAEFIVITLQQQQQ